jgi:hypothetical protein
MFMKRNLWLVLVSLAVLAVGCSRVGDRTDAQVASDVTDKIKADNSVPDKQLTIAANSGTVTLSGNVSSDAARNAAASDAGQVAGVKTVINNLQVAPVSAANQAPPQASSYPPPAPTAREERRPSPRTREKNLRPSSGNNNGDDNSRNLNPSNGNGNDSNAIQRASSASAATGPAESYSALGNAVEHSPE